MSLTDTAPSRIGQVPGKEAATLAVTHAKDIAVAAGARVKATLLVEADPAEALLSSSKQHLGDLIVIGARSLVACSVTSPASSSSAPTATCW